MSWILGDQCKFSHDLRAFWDRKPADLGPECPLYRAFGFCRFGITCRYAADHVCPETLENRLTDACKAESGGLECNNGTPGETNRLNAAVRIQLRRREYNFDRAIDVSSLMSSKWLTMKINCLNLQFLKICF